MSERGKYIVIEGSDGTGKSTQAIDLSQQLELLGHRTLNVFNDDTLLLEPVQEPGGTPRANELRRRIKDRSIPRTPWENVEWFTEARASVWNEAILPALENGIHVVTARNFWSTIAYQGYGEGIPIDEIMEYTREKVGEGYMTPDLMCILALKNEQVRRSRIQGRGTDATADTFESMPDDFQERMQFGYIDFAEKNGLQPVDATRDQDAVFDDIWEQTETLLLPKHHLRLAA